MWSLGYKEIFSVVSILFHCLLWCEMQTFMSVGPVLQLTARFSIRVGIERKKLEGDGESE